MFYTSNSIRRCRQTTFSCTSLTENGQNMHKIVKTSDFLGFLLRNFNNLVVKTITKKSLMFKLQRGNSDLKAFLSTCAWYWPVWHAFKFVCILDQYFLSFNATQVTVPVWLNHPCTYTFSCSLHPYLAWRTMLYLIFLLLLSYCKFSKDWWWFWWSKLVMVLTKSLVQNPKSYNLSI